MNANRKPVLLVTGGAQRVGNTIVRTLASQGYRTVIHFNTSDAAARATQQELAEAGHEAICLQADLSDPLSLEKMVHRAHSQWGQIDALVNCASVWESEPLERVTVEQLQHNFSVNVQATFLCCQKVGLLMCEQEQGGAIVNFGDWAIARPYLDYAAYFPSKGAIPTLTHNMALELAHRNPRVRVNAILPGPVLLSDHMSGPQQSRVVQATLVKREGDAEHLAHAVQFLIENDFVCGVCLPVDGGRSIYSPDSAVR